MTASMRCLCDWKPRVLCPIHGDARDHNVIPTLRPALQDEIEARDERERTIFIAGFGAGLIVFLALWLLVAVIS